MVLDHELEQRHPVELGHAQIGDEHIDVILAQHFLGGSAVADGEHLVPIPLELRLEHAPEVRLVIRDEDLLLLGHARIRRRRIGPHGG